MEQGSSPLNPADNDQSFGSRADLNTPAKVDLLADSFMGDGAEVTPDILMDDSLEPSLLSNDQIRFRIEETRRLEDLDDLRCKRETEAQERTEREHHLMEALSALREAKTLQLQRIADAEAESLRLAEEGIRLQAKAEDRLKQAEMDQRAFEDNVRLEESRDEQHKQEQQHRAEQLKAIRSGAEEATLQRSKEIEGLHTEIAALRKLEADQVTRIAEAEAIIVSLEEAHHQAEATERQEIGKEQRLKTELEELSAAIAASSKRITEATAESRQLAEDEANLRRQEKELQQADKEERERFAEERRAQAEVQAQQRAKEEEKHLAELEEIHLKLEQEAEVRRETEDQLNLKIGALRKLEEEQRQRVSGAEVELQQAQAEVSFLSEEQIRLRTETEALQKERLESERVAGLEMQRLLESQAEECAVAEAQRLEALDAIRCKSEAEALERTKQEHDLMEALSALREAEALQLQRIAEADVESQRLAEEGLRLQAEAEDRLKQAEMRQRAFEENVRLEESRNKQFQQEQQQQAEQLEALRNDAEQAAQQRNERIESLNSKIAAFQEIAVEQSSQIQEAETRLLALEEKRGFSHGEAERLAAEYAKRLEELEAFSSQTEIEMQQRAEKEQRLQAGLNELRKAETEQLQRIAEAETELQRLTEESLRLKAEEARRCAEFETRQRAFEEQIGLEETQARQRAHAEQQRVDQLEAIRQAAEQGAQQRNEKIVRLYADVAALAELEAQQSQQLQATQEQVQEAEARLRDLEAEVLLKSQEVARLAAEEETRRQPQAEARQRTFVEEIRLTEQPNGAGAKTLHPLETWQFPLTTELTEASGPEVALRSTEVTEDIIPKAIATNIETSLELEVQAELFRLELETSFWQTAEQDRNLVQAKKDSGDQSRILDLVEKLKSGDAEKRAEAVQELAQLGEEEVFSMFTDLFEDNSAAVRNAAALTLHEIKPHRVASFTRAFREASAKGRLNIAAAIEGSGLAAQAIQNLNGTDREKSSDAFSILFLMAKAGQVEILFQTIQEHPDCAVRLSVVKLLTFCNLPDIIPAFRNLAIRAALPTEVRSVVMEAIYEISGNVNKSSLSVA